MTLLTSSQRLALTTVAVGGGLWEDAAATGATQTCSEVTAPHTDVYLSRG